MAVFVGGETVEHTDPRGPIDRAEAPTVSARMSIAKWEGIGKADIFGLTLDFLHIDAEGQRTTKFATLLMKSKPAYLFFAKTLADCGIKNIAAFASTSVLL